MEYRTCEERILGELDAAEKRIEQMEATEEALEMDKGHLLNVISIAGFQMRQAVKALESGDSDKALKRITKVIENFDKEIDWYEKQYEEQDEEQEQLDGIPTKPNIEPIDFIEPINPELAKKLDEELERYRRAVKEEIAERGIDNILADYESEGGNKRVMKAIEKRFKANEAKRAARGKAKGKEN